MVDKKRLDFVHGSVESLTVAVFDSVALVVVAADVVEVAESVDGAAA